MLSILKIKPKTYIGLDIRAEEIRFVEFSRIKEKFHLKRSAIAGISSGIFEEGQCVAFDVLTREIKKLVLQHHLKGSHVGIALPSQLVFFKNIQLPAELTPLECRYEILNSLQQYLPDSTEEIEIDLVFQGQLQGHHKILLVAAKRSLLQTYQKAIETAGLKLHRIDVDWYALLRGVNAFNSPSVLLDIEPKRANFIVQNQKEIIFQQRLNFLSSQELSEKIQQLFTIFYSLNSAVTLQKMILSGAEFFLNDSAEKLKQMIALPIEWHNEFSLAKGLALAGYYGRN